MQEMNRTFLLMLMISAVLPACSQDIREYEKRSFINRGDTLPYRILYPENYQVSKKYPLVLFLHGSGERGSDNVSHLKYAGRVFASKENRAKFPAIVILPQCPHDSYWSNVNIHTDPAMGRTFNYQHGGTPTKAMELLMALIGHVQQHESIDTKRMYVGGLSMGGMGTFELLTRMPDTFIAAIAICGGGDTAAVKTYAKKVHTWIFHGWMDDVVPPAFSIRMAEALKKEGADVLFTMYPKANHNSWDAALAEPDLLPWLFSFQK
jgi:predicted peptidase